MNEMVVNWHITEACNYHCRYCFAKWEHNGRELVHTPAHLQTVVSEIPKLIDIINKKFGSDFQIIRLNLVGGEPLLYPEAIKNIVAGAADSGLVLSIITNGSLLDKQWIEILTRSFVQIGLSVDSVREQTNAAIGRKTNKLISQPDKLVESIAAMRAISPNIGIKINTVVNELNFNEDMNGLIAAVLPQKWKIFKMLPIVTNALSISQQQFEHFLANHQKFRSIISAENNDEMTQSYLMIDPEGRFFQNTQGGGAYQYSRPIHQVGIEQAFDEITFHLDKFKHRYIPVYAV
ncbi:viperin family antiviral radical SAM protein [Conchiformibius steedae]|uniref:S-adenosylmethionine-dependent nucleotide dehydratase n=1 Tax=Conchiformibius steedae TaxID=153493 RepID=A0A3P2A7A8_9NEIS|nr:viperin family antiviral radical SAM protein [Conchiformibius steedae]RRD90776.1 radical SAM protein [Conchiformibius steedae]